MPEGHVQPLVPYNLDSYSRLLSYDTKTDVFSEKFPEAIFSRLNVQTRSGGVLKSILDDLKRFWVPFEFHYGSNFALKMHFWGIEF